MDYTLLGKLYQLTGTLKPTGNTTVNDLKTFQRRLANELIRNPDLDISGNQLHHEGVMPDSTPDLFERFSHISDLFEGGVASPTEATAGPAPLVFRRETAFRNNILGNSVPSWGSGMQATHSYGPFIDEHGLPIWFDFFLAIKTVKVFIQGESLPSLLIPVRGVIAAQNSYRIESGSVWVASHLIARTPLLKGYYTGLKISGGTLHLSANPVINNGNIIINPASTANTQLELRQNTTPPVSPDAGFDAEAAIVELPVKFELTFNAANSSITASDASCTVFGNESQFHFKNVPPVFIDVLGQLLIPYKVTSTGNEPGTFNIHSSLSKLCSFTRKAVIDENSGWLLPAAKIDPSQLGEAAGTGSLCIGLKKGIVGHWKGLKGGNTKFNHPAVIAEPGMLSVIDFFAENSYGKQKWELWQNAGSRHHSEIAIGFGNAFPFVFISHSKGTETILYFCNHKASFDRPLDANGSPFKIESSIALGSIVQTEKIFRASLLDNDLLFDGNFNKPEGYKKFSLALRNAFFSVTAPYSLFLSGELEQDNKVITGAVSLVFGMHRYLPTLPDPYVASYTTALRGQRDIASGNLQMALAAFIKWPNKGQAANPEDGINDWAYLYFRFAPLNFPLLSARASLVNTDTGFKRTDRNFQKGVVTFNRNLVTPVSAVDQSIVSPGSTTHEPELKALQAVMNPNLADTVKRFVHSEEISAAIADLEANALLRSVKDKKRQVNEVLNTTLQNSNRNALGMFSNNAMNNMAGANDIPFATSNDRGLLVARDSFMLLDVSSNADLMGVSFGMAIQVNRDQQGDTHLRTVNAFIPDTGVVDTGMPLQILNMDVVANGRNVRAVTLPQISWEPVLNIPLEIQGRPDPLDTITVTPGLIVYDNDGIPTRIFSESPYQVPITPLSVTHHFLKEYNDKKVPRQLHAMFTLPFAMIAQAAFERNINEPENENARLRFNMPWFDGLRGGLQIKTEAPDVVGPDKESRKPSFTGWTLQLEHNLKWFLFGVPLSGSTLGNIVKKVFNKQFFSPNHKVPLERMEISGYGASIFSDWTDKKAAIAEVSQAKFDVIVGRTGHEVIQVRSIMYPFAVHVVRTITLMRSPNGYVFRSDSGWKAESDGFFDFNYTINFENFPDEDVLNPYNIHHEVVKGVSNVREIRDYPAGGLFTSSFTTNDPGLPPVVFNLTPAKWQDLFTGIMPGDKLDVEMQAVLFDADVHMRNITSGGVKDTVSGDHKVQSRKMLGYVQLAPAKILVPGHVFADLLNFQNGSLGGAVDSIMDIAASKQKMRIIRADVSPAHDSAGAPVFVSAARGSLLLPQDGSWSVVKQHTDTGDVKPVEEGQTVPLIKANGSDNFRIANPADILVTNASKINYGVLQSTGTQKLLFDIPQFKNGVEKLLSNQTFFADAYKLLNSKGVFPNIANALQLTNAEKEIAILGEGLMKMADRDINVSSLLPGNYQYVFIEEPDILKVYAEYSSTGGNNSNLKLGIDSSASLADNWKAALSNVRIVVDLGPFPELMWVDGNFNASSGVSSALDKPNLQFGPILQPVVDILRVLAMLTGDDFDKGMKVGMSNSPDNWEYKFDCSKEIPVIKFPSPTQLTINPNPPLKLEAGLKVGFYFNQMLFHSHRSEAIGSSLRRLC